MQKYVEATGKTEEAAIESALRTLGLDRDDVSVEILERAKSGFLGIGSSPAKVKVTYEAPDEPEEAVPPQKPKGEEAAAAAIVTRGKAIQADRPEREAPAAPAQPEPREKSAAPVAEDETAARITDFLTGLLSHMGSTATPVVRLGEENTYEVELVGEHLGGLIGRRGETLDAIQQLTNYSVNHGQSKRVRIHIDAEGYRAKREESLQRLALKMAGKVVKYRKSMTLEAMNAYERHVIHTTLQDYPNVTTDSTGVEPNRRTVVAYAPGQK